MLTRSSKEKLLNFIFPINNPPKNCKYIISQTEVWHMCYKAFQLVIGCVGVWIFFLLWRENWHHSLTWRFDFIKTVADSHICLRGKSVDRLFRGKLNPQRLWEAILKDLTESVIAAIIKRKIAHKHQGVENRIVAFVRPGPENSSLSNYF